MSSSGDAEDYFEKFPRANDSMIQVMEQLLEFNPKFRASAMDSLKHPEFDRIRRQFI